MAFQSYLHVIKSTGQSCINLEIIVAVADNISEPASRTAMLLIWNTYSCLWT